MSVETEQNKETQNVEQTNEPVEQANSSVLIEQFVQISKAQTEAIQTTLKTGLESLANSFSEGLTGLGERQKQVLDNLVNSSQQVATSAKSTLHTKQVEWQQAEELLKKELKEQYDAHANTVQSLQALQNQHNELQLKIDQQRQLAVNAKMEKDLVTSLTGVEIQPALMEAAVALFKQQLSYKESADATFIGDVPIQTAIQNWVKTKGTAFVKPPMTTGGTTVPEC